jgi:putative PIN family toxin of toxin-antitoxin system
VRAILDPNVLISALLSATGAPAQVVRAWLAGRFELVVSPLLLAEIERALAYPKLRKRIPPDEAKLVVELLQRSATLAQDPDADPPRRSVDPGDDYLLVLAAVERVALVSGDKHLLALEGDLPIFAAAAFLAVLER